MCHDGVGEGRVSLRLGFALANGAKGKDCRVRSSSEKSTMTIDLRGNWYQHRYMYLSLVIVLSYDIMLTDLRPNWAISIVSISVGG